MERPSGLDFAVGMTFTDAPVAGDRNDIDELTVVLGGTGKTGRRVAAGLRARGRPARIGSRSAAVPFDWERPTTWGPVLQGAASVYVAYAPDAGLPGAAETIGALASTAVRSGVRRVVLLTGRGEPGALRSEQVVQGSGADWTVVRSSFFAQNFSEDFLAGAVQAGLVTFPAGNVAEPFIDAQDVADVAVAALTQSGHHEQVYDVTGPDLITFADAVDQIARAVGREIVYLPVSSVEFATGLIADGVPRDFAEPFAELLSGVLDGRNAQITDGVERALGRPARSFSAYVHRAAQDGAWSAVAPVAG